MLSVDELPAVDSGRRERPARSERGGRRGDAADVQGSHSSQRSTRGRDDDRASRKRRRLAAAEGRHSSRRRSRSSSSASSSSRSSASQSRSPSPASSPPSSRRRARSRSSHREGRREAKRRHSDREPAAAGRVRAARAGQSEAEGGPAVQSAAALAGYTDQDNPFNDQQLTAPFVWHKRQQSARHSQQPQRTTAEERQARQAALVAEVEEVKQRRREREEERRAMEALKEQMERERAAEQVAGWEEKEEDFHRQQARQRTKIRVLERRERPVDLLMKNVAFEQWLAEDEEEERIRLQRLKMASGAATPTASAVSGSSTRSSLLREAPLTNPASLLSALPLSDLVELQADLAGLLRLNEHMEYWSAIATLCDAEVAKCKGERAAMGVASDVMRDVVAMVRDASVSELHSLSQQVQRALEDGADLPYWRIVSQQLQLQQAKAHLRETHADRMRRRLELLKEERRKRNTQLQQQPPQQRQQRPVEEQIRPTTSDADDISSGISTNRPVLEVDTLITQMSVDAMRGSSDAQLAEESNADHHLSPRLFSTDEQLDVPVIDVSDDQRAMSQQRAAVLAQYQPHTTLQRLHGSEAADTFSRSVEVSSAAEHAISNEVRLPANSSPAASQLPWSSKWRPRKPRYFNRVKTGFDWNKYNQVHYDKDNPPPKLVQGYKFNVFYPDLLDPSHTPTYRMQPLPGDEQGAYCILRFSAGPPYEDVAFKIVRKEWEFAPRRGFRCTFDKGVMQLHFNFKRYFYRR